MTGPGPNLGVTLYSFTPEFHQHQHDLESLINKVGELGMGPGLEIVGFQSIKNFPQVSDEFADWFKALLDENHLEQTCLDANVDIGLRSDRLLTEDELVDYMEVQIAAAQKLGFPVVRMQYAASPALMVRLVPAAERANVKLGVEIHAPHSVNHPTVQRLREAYEKADSPYLGFIPDFGASTVRIPNVFLDGYRHRGVSDRTVDLVTKTWQEARIQRRDPFEVRAELRDRVDALGGGDYDRALAWHAFEYFGHQEAPAWIEIMPQVFHVHAKFFEIDANGNEPSVPYEELVNVFRENGYSGSLSSEYEGWQWDENPHGMADGFAMVEGHQKLVRSVLGHGVPA